MAFYEPVSVFLATLTLWAYSSYASRASPLRHGNPTDEAGDIRSGSNSREQSPSRDERYHGAPPETPSDGQAHGCSPATTRVSQISVSIQSSLRSTLTADPDPTFIRLDRPCDDELVCLYVRQGRPSAMRAYITGVGDICSPKGPVRILKEGRKILNTLSITWGRTRKYIDILEAVEQATKDVSSAYRFAPG